MTPFSLDEAMQVACANHRAGRFSQAETGYREILARDPNQPDALHLLGVLASQTGNPAAAIALIRRAIAVYPIASWFHNDLGSVCTEAGQLEEAIEAYSAAIRLEPGLAPFHHHLGNALNRSGRLDEAIAAYRRALEIDPTSAGAHSDLSNALVANGRPDEAMTSCQRAIELKPALTEARRNLGLCQAAVGRIHEAISTLRQGVELDPGDSKCHSDLLFSLLHHAGYGPQELLEEHREWNRRHAEPFRALIQPHLNEPSPERPLRIGYVSPDFCDHAVGHNLLPLFRQHDRQAFEIFAYSMTVRHDAIFDQLKALCGNWRNIVGMADERAAELIRKDRIDILVDLALHTAGNRLPLFARKPAPVQVTFLGYCGTTGLDAIDYRLSDPYLDPPDTDRSCSSEQTVRLANSFWCYEPFGPAPDVSPGPVSASDYLTFGCLNNFSKVSPPALELWRGILRAVPESRLLLQAPAGSAREAVVQRFSRAGLDQRLDFVGREEWKSYLQNVQRLDIALDPFPYGGGVTTCDALWMGVPVVSLAGKTGVGRGGRSILSNLGLQNLVADAPGQYVEIAVALANDRPRLAELRATLRERMEKSPLRDASGYARDVEAAYRTMWRTWCNRPSVLPS